MSLLHGSPAALGDTGLPVTRIGLGLAALGRPGYINLGHAGDLGGATAVDAMRERAFEVLDAAWAAGVRYFDAARSYGRAEEFLGEWLVARGLRATTMRAGALPGSPVEPLEAAGVDSGEVALAEVAMALGAAAGTPAPTLPPFTVGSKWGYTYTADWRVDVDIHEVKDLTLATLQRQEHESIALLGESLGLYQIHSATLESGVLSDNAVLDELAQLRAAGFAIGLSVSGPRQGETILAALEAGGFDAVQATFNLLDVSAGPALAQAHAAGLGVLVKEGVANGRLTARTGPEPTAAVVRAATVLTREAAGLGVTEDAVALSFVLAQPWVDVVLSGATTVPMLESNLAAAELASRLEVDLDLFAGLAQPVEEYWAERAALPWN